MEKMENEFRALFREVSPSVVIVERVGRIDYFCVGSIILSEGESTFILTQSKITDSTEKLSICFSNGSRQSASLLVKLEEEKLCILVTKFFAKCKVLQFSGGDINHTYVGTIGPATRSSVYSLPGFIIQRPCEAGSHTDQSVTADSQDYFTFTCQYGECSANTVSRLLSGPVFNLPGQALGVVIDDLEERIWPKKEDGTIIHKEFYYRTGSNLKVGMTVSKLQALLRNLDEDWQSRLKQMALEEKLLS